MKKGIEEKEVNGKEKGTVIDKILSYSILTDEEIDQYVNDYIYGNRTEVLYVYSKEYGYIAELLQNSVTQIKPPKSAIDKCTNPKAISRIVLQGKGGEKTIVSKAGGMPEKFLM